MQEFIFLKKVIVTHCKEYKERFKLSNSGNKGKMSSWKAQRNKNFLNRVEN